MFHSKNYLKDPQNKVVNEKILIDVSNCKLDGSTDGIFQNFNTARYQACKLHTNNDRIYYDGFVTGCMQIGNTKLICETVADSSILNIKTQPRQTPKKQTIQPTAVGVKVR
jgi:hypothetical protein